MKALITASFAADGLRRLARHMEVVHEDWRERHTIYFDAARFAARINEAGADVLIVEADLAHEDVLNNTQLRLIGCCRGDPINIGLARATELRIPVLFAPGRNADAVADLTLAFMLALARHVYTVNWLLKSGQMTFNATGDYLTVYGRYGGFELGGITVGVVGFGAIGRRVVQRVRAFGSRVLVYDPFVSAEAIQTAGAQPASLDEVVRAADMLTLHCPDTPENHHLITAERIRAMKRGAYFLNLARAAIVDDQALYEALRDGHLAGAALDVFADEPVRPENRYVQLPNVLVAPHLGGATRDVVQHQTDLIVDGIEAWLRGERPRYVANPAALSSEGGRVTAIVALDAGTGGAKCAVFDVKGQLLATRSQRWNYTVVANRDLPLIKEYSFDPDAFWQILARCTRDALEASGVAAHDVIGVATTSQREGCVFLDVDGRELYAGPNLDSRAFMEGLEVLGTLGNERLYAITGHSAPFIFPLARYLWYRKQGGAPVARLLMINDWMTFRLCGVPSTEPSNATESMLFDLRRREWSQEILQQFDIPSAMLPPLFASGERVGAVHAAAAAATGLAPGTPVFTGGADTQCALLGAGAVEVGDVAVILGTTTPIQAVVGEPLLDPAANLWAGCHVVPERWVLESNAGSTGDAYLWLLELLVHTPGDRFAHAEELARDERDSGTFSFIGPRVFNLTQLRPDMPGGVLFRFPILQLRPSAGDVLRGFLESVACAVRANVAQVEAVTAQPTARLIAGGGLSRSDVLMQLTADIAGLPVQRACEAESTGLGCAILVASGAGVYSDTATAARAMCRHRVVAPNPERWAESERSFAKWRELYDSLGNLSL